MKMNEFFDKMYKNYVRNDEGKNPHNKFNIDIGNSFSGESLSISNGRESYIFAPWRSVKRYIERNLPELEPDNGDYAEAVEELLEAVQKVSDAWTVEGKRPSVHKSAQRRLEKDWSTLTRAIGRIIVANNRFKNAVKRIQK